VRAIKKLRLFFFNAALLSFVNVLVRLITVSFNAYVSAKVGAEGMGLITLVMSVYGLSVTVAASGVNLAAMRLTAEALAKSESEGFACGRRRMGAVMGACTGYSLLFGIFAGVSLFAASGWIGTALLGDGRTVPSLRALAISLPAISMSSALGGYFTGMRQVYKNAAVTVTEQFVKITLSAAALLLLAPAGVEYACLSIVGSAALAEGASLVVSLLLYAWDCRKTKSTAKAAPLPPADRRAFPRVFHTAFPVAAGAYARQGLVTAEHLAIPWGLRKSGANASEALASYGVLHGMVYPLIFFPSAVLGAFASLLIPEFAACRQRGETERIRHMAERVMETALLFSIGVSGIFLAFGHSIASGLYPGTDAAVHLAVFAPLIPVMYLDTAVDSMLKGLGQQMHCMKVNIADSLCCLVLVLLLLPRMGLRGYYVVQYACELMNAALSITRLLSVTGLRVRLVRWVVRPTVSVILASSILRIASMSGAIPLIGAAGEMPVRIGATAVLYLLFAAGPVFLRQYIQSRSKGRLSAGKRNAI